MDGARTAASALVACLACVGGVFPLGEASAQLKTASETDETNAMTAREQSSALPSPACEGSSASPTLRQVLASQLGPSPVERIGPTAEALAGEFHTRVCAFSQAAKLLPNLCAGAGATAPTGEGRFDELILRLELDLLGAPVSYAEQTSNFPDDEQLAAIRWLATLGGNIQPGLMAQRLAVQYGLVEHGECKVPVLNTDGAMRRAVLLHWALAQDSDADPNAVIDAVLGSTAQVEGGPSRKDSSRRRALIRATELMHTSWRQFDGSSKEANDLLAVLESQLTAFQVALRFVNQRPITIAPEALALVKAASRGDVEGVIEMLGQWLAGRGYLPESVLRAARLVLRFSRARTIGEAEKALLVEALGLGPWTRGLILGASASVPVVQSQQNLSLVGDATLGYDAEAWGLAVFGAGSLYNFEVDNQSATTTVKWEVNADGWLSLALTRRTQLDFRASFNHTYFDSDKTVQDPVFATDEDSWVVRGLGFVGVRHQHPYLALGVWVGGGTQLESADNFAFVDGVATINQSTTLGGEGEARVRVQWDFVPSVLAARASLNWKYYTLTRLETGVVSDLGTQAMATFVPVDERSIQIETIGRLFVDLEVARFFDLVPGVGAGIDHYQLAIQGSETQVATIPVYSVGIRSTVF